MRDIVIRQPTYSEFDLVKDYVDDFWLDDSNMQIQQFRVLFYKGEITAFGRLRMEGNDTELCTLGVVEKMRGKGFGKAMVKALIEEAKTDVYAVCVIPDFFLKLGFVKVTEYPPLIKRKVDVCTTYYHVGVPYEVMKYKFTQKTDIFE